jgi:Cyclic nucleotide-binding domain
MLNRFTEKKIHLVRWLLVIGWLILIASAFYDPLSLWLTDAKNLWSPIHISLDRCILVQGKCLPQTSYVLAPQIFWGIVIPLGVIILLVGGHETWRRICPLYFISQIPRYLGLQRNRGKRNPETGAVRRDLVGIKPGSWLGKNFGYLQFGLLFLGLNLRLLVANGNGVGFGFFVLSSIFGALTVGYLFKGRSWCQYFCPMAPVQIFYTSNRGLLGSDAHLSPVASVTQSMCRSTEEKGKEKSACVSCQSPCIDIDAERTYWANIELPERKLLFYGYFGLMLGFFLYFYLYAGNWEYYFSGVWSHDPQQFSSLLQPGFYIAGQTIAIPKILAVPLTLGISTYMSYRGGLAIEQLLTNWRNHHKKNWTVIQIRHFCFIFAVYISFNVFFVFAGRPTLRKFPYVVELLFNAFCIIVSTLWLQRNLTRSKPIYQRESLTGSLRRQLQKLDVNWQEFLEGRSIDDLDTNEVYVLAKVLPGFNHQSRQNVYQGVLQDALSEGKTQSADSLEMLQGMREELQITTDEHYRILANLGVGNPTLLDPSIQRSLENQLRLESYQRYLETLLLDLVANCDSIEQAFVQKQEQIESIRQEYGITIDEQEKVLLSICHPNSTLLLTSVQLLTSLQSWSTRYHSLANSSLNKHKSIYKIFRSILIDQQKAIITQLFNILEILIKKSVSVKIAATIGYLAPEAVCELLAVETERNRLTHLIRKILTSQAQLSPRCLLTSKKAGFNNRILNSTSSQILEIGSSPIPEATFLEVLYDLVHEVDPLLQALSLYVLKKIDPDQAKTKAYLLDGEVSLLVQETINQVLLRSQSVQKKEQSLAHDSNALLFPNENIDVTAKLSMIEQEADVVTTIEKLLWFRASKFFVPFGYQSLIELAQRSYLRVFEDGESLCEQGDLADSLLLVISGKVRIDQEILGAGNVIGELGILTKSTYRKTVVAHTSMLPALVIDAKSFNDLLDRDSIASRALLVSVSNRLQLLATDFNLCHDYVTNPRKNDGNCSTQME